MQTTEDKKQKNAKLIHNLTF